MTVRQATPDIMGDVLGKAPSIERVAVKAIKVDGGTQMRAALNPETVGEYADAMKEGWGGFPPVVLYYDGSDYWLADGFHRVAAIKVAKDAWIDDLVVPADVRAGSRRDAVLHAAGANASHGLRRTNQDKRRSVEVLLRDPEWAKWSDGEIARRCAVSDRFVASLRKELTPNGSESTTRIGADGRVYQTANIGANQPQYAPVWVLQGHVDEFARANGWLARELRTAARNQRNDENYVLLEAAITVGHRRADLVQAINNVADAWESREEQQRKAREWQVVQLPADIAGSGYQIHWKAAEGWRVLDPDGGHVQTGLNALSECANLIRRLVPPAVPAGRPMMEVIKTDAELADDAWRADIASREAAADEAERQAAADDGAELNDFALLTAMRRYWSDHVLRSFASDAEPEAACRRHIVKSPSGSVDDQFRIETGQGHVSIWLKKHGDYWHRKADGTYTYSRWAKLTIGLLPQLLPAQVVAEREAAADEAERQAAAAPRKVVRDWILVTDRLRRWLGKRYETFTSEDAAYSIREMLDNWLKGNWRADLEEFTATLPDGWTQQALDGAIREVHAEYAPDFHPVEIDPWAAALATSGSRQHRAELLAEALQPWILAYQDEYGRTWRDLARGGNPSHTNSTFWRHITAEAKRRSITAFQDDLWKFAIKQAFSWLEANEPSAAADVTPVTPAVDADKLLVDWTDDDWETHALRSQAEAPAAEPQRRVDEDAILTPVSLRPDYDSDEWYTPAEYIEAARTVMGSIDLDPASCELAQTVVQADVYLTKIENGLGQMWIRETVWLNPPYGQAEPWVAKLLAEFDGGAFVQQAVVLLNNMTETAYFQALLTRFPVCFPNRRIPFWRHDQQGLTGRQGQALFYLGPNVERFVEVFGAFGPVLRRV